MGDIIIPMKTKAKAKTKASASTKAPKIKNTETIMQLCEDRCNEVASALEGSIRLRAERWHGETSLYDTNRIYTFLLSQSQSAMFDIKRFQQLAQEIPSLFKVLGSNLSRAIAALLNAPKNA